MPATNGLSGPAALETSHDTDSFDCGNTELTQWIQQWALQNHKAGNARVYVTAREQRVLGYYALASAGAEKKRLPDKLTTGVPDQVSCILLARLAVDNSVKGQGVGKALLKDAIKRVANVSDQIGVRALLIHAIDDEAKNFYNSLVGFLDSPTDPLHLFLPIKEVKKFTAS